MKLHGMNMIGSTCSSEGTNSFQSSNPATGVALETVYRDATEGEMDRAMAGARAAFEEYREKTPAERADFLRLVAERIDALGDELTAMAGAETGLPAARLNGERSRTVNQVRMFASLIEEGSWVDARIDRADPARQPLPKPGLRRMLIPMGPVAVFGASNFPLAFSVCGGDTASALAAGNPVVVKAHPAHPGTSEMVAQAIAGSIEASGMPSGLFSMVHGQSPDVGLYLVRHPFARAVGFTGSLRAGRALMDAAAARPEPIPVYAEMGSVNPVFILPGAMAERGPVIAAGLVNSVILGAGQFCTNPGLVFGVADAAFEQFVSEAGEKMAATNGATMLHAGICRAYSEGVAGLAGASGVTRVAAGADVDGVRGQGMLFRTDAAHFAGNPALQEEIFGPSSLLVGCGGVGELAALARGLHGNLTATVHGTEEDLAEAGPLLAVLREKVGRLLFNGFPTGVEVAAAMHHGGPYPACSDVRSTSVGTAAIRRFARPICFQDAPQSALPAELRDVNSRGIWRLVDGVLGKDDC